MFIKDTRIVRLSAVLLVVTHYNVNAQIRFDSENIANGSYYYEYNDGLSSKGETGNLDFEGFWFIKGQYRYVLEDKEYIVTYTADKDGYHPKVTISDYLPPLGSGAYDPKLVASLLG